MSKNTQRYAVWLLPGGEAAREFSGLIATLAQHYQSPGFKPHVTLACGTDEARLRRGLEQLARSQRGIRVQPDGLMTEAAFYRHLAINIVPNHSLHDLWRATADLCRDYRSFQPHLSLLYRDHTHRDQAGYIRMLAGLKLAPFSLDSLALIELNTDPADWRERCRLPLVR